MLMIFVGYTFCFHLLFFIFLGVIRIFVAFLLDNLDALHVYNWGGWMVPRLFLHSQFVTGDVVVTGFSSIISGDEGTNKW